jgi:hypothetical protein
METKTMREKPKCTVLERWLLILLLAQAPILQAGCGYLAAGAAGAAVGHEIAEEEEEDDEE